MRSCEDDNTRGGGVEKKKDSKGWFDATTKIDK